MPLINGKENDTNINNTAQVNEGSESSEDEQEETFKNIISSKGKFASFLLRKNSGTDLSLSVHHKNESLSKSFIKSSNKALVK